MNQHGIAEAQRVAGVGSFYVGQNMDLPHLLEQSLRAHVVYHRDRDYIVMPTENPHTGRMEPSIVIVDGLVWALYCPSTSMNRPSRGERWSAATTRQIGFFLPPTRVSLSRTATDSSRNA